MGNAFLDHNGGSEPTSRKVLIIGAGPVGATFAQILRKYHISFEIFDREPSMNARKGGTFLLDSGLPHILPLVHRELADLSSVGSNSATGKQDTMAFINGIKCAVGMTRGESAPGKPGYSVCARRADYREWMCQQLPVQFNKRLSHYKEDERGVTAYFQDGTSARGAILVGADGASSVVRAQLLGNPTRPVNRHIPICASVELDRKDYEPLHALANSMIVANTPTCHVMLSQSDIDSDGAKARFWWLCSFVSQDAERDAAWVADAEPEALFRRALESSKDLPEVVVEAIRRTGPSGIWRPQIKFAEFVPPETLPDGRVTLLGDALHTAAPFGGQGVNCGLRGAAELGKVLGEEMTGGKAASRAAVSGLLKRYEDVMIPQGRHVVLDARAKGECQHLLNPNPNMKLPPGMKRLEKPIPLEKADWTKTQKLLASMS